MRLAVSNIAWDVSEDAAVTDLLARHAVDAIDVAPSKYFPDPVQARDDEIAKVKNWWADRGVAITGMQALLFGTTGLDMFSSVDQPAMLAHLAAVCHIAEGLGATRLVFGSPRNRDRSGLGDERTFDVATSFFRQLGDIAEHHGVVICLEPIPQRYGANFMTTSDETADVVRRVAHTAIKMQLDTGAVTLGEEDINAVLKSHGPLVGHVHLSEPHLLPLGDLETDHTFLGRAVQKHLPQHVASIEMLATKDEPHVVSIERALVTATTHYRAPLRT